MKKKMLAKFKIFTLLNSQLYPNVCLRDVLISDLSGENTEFNSRTRYLYLTFFFRYS